MNETGAGALLPLIYLVIIVIAFFHIKMIIYKTK